MKAFKNTPITKEKLLEHLEEHRRADAFTKGQYSNSELDVYQHYPPNQFKGCAIGCAVNSINYELNHGSKWIENSDHRALGNMLNIPFNMLLFIDNIFELMDIDEGKNLMIDFIKNVKVGSDLSVINCYRFTALKREYCIRFNGNIATFTNASDARDYLFKMLNKIEV